MRVRFRLTGAVLLTLGLLALYAARVGAYGLLEPDEARYAAVAREMAETGDWLVPHLNGIAHLTKPPLAYWSAALAYRVAGPSEAATRAGPLVAALVTLAATFATARRLADETAALFAVAVLATSPEFFIMGRTLTPDIFLTAACTVALLGAVRQPDWTARALFWGGLGVAFLAKGPVALLVVLGALSGLACTTSGRRRLAGLACWWGALLFAVVGLGWYAAVAWKTPGVLAYWVGPEVVGRIASDIHHRTRPWYFFLPVLALGLLPWSLALPFALRAWTRPESPAADGRRLVVAWLVVPVVALSLVRSKLPTYVLPVFPAAALLVGETFARLPALAPTRGARLTASAFGIVGLAVGAGMLVPVVHLPVDVHRFFVPDAPLELELHEVLGPLAVACVGGAWLALRGQARRAAMVWVAGSAVMLVQVAVEMDDVAAAQSLRGFSTAVGRDPIDRVVAFHVNRYGLRFYTGRPVLEVGGGRDLRFEPDPQAAGRLAPPEDEALTAAYADTAVHGGRVFVLARAVDTGRVRALVPAALEPLGAAGDLVLLGRPPPAEPQGSAGLSPPP